MAATFGSVLRVISMPISPNDQIESKPLTLVLLNRRSRKNSDFKMINLLSTNLVKRKRLFCSRISNCSNPSMDSRILDLSSPEDWFLKNKGQEVALLLNGRSTYLVGMMGCGKTTVGKTLAEALGYSFVDSDRCVEEAEAGTTVKQIFEHEGELKFRKYETRELEKLSMVPKQVVATGGGAVITPINWKYMTSGITVFLDVPIDVLAKRLATADNSNRPILELESADPDKVLAALCNIMNERGRFYTQAQVIVSLQDLAVELELEDAYHISTNAIALQVLVQIQGHLKGQN